MAWVGGGGGIPTGTPMGTTAGAGVPAKPGLGPAFIGEGGVVQPGAGGGGAGGCNGVGGRLSCAPPNPGEAGAPIAGCGGALIGGAPIPPGAGGLAGGTPNPVCCWAGVGVGKLGGATGGAPKDGPRAGGALTVGAAMNSSPKSDRRTLLALRGIGSTGAATLPTAQGSE
jgi:hypothetical protein